MNDPVYVWGVDPSTQLVALAWTGPHRGVISHTFVGKRREGERLAHIHAQVREMALEHACRVPPYCVWVEQPTGRFPKPQLLYAAGVIQAAIYDALQELWEAPVPVWTIPVKDWKRRSVGSGAATKQQVLAWARSNGYPGASEDEADAWAIAHAGAAMIAVPDAA